MIKAQMIKAQMLYTVHFSNSKFVLYSRNKYLPSYVLVRYWIIPYAWLEKLTEKVNCGCCVQTYRRVFLFRSLHFLDKWKILAGAGHQQHATYIRQKIFEISFIVKHNLATNLFHPWQTHWDCTLIDWSTLVNVN